MPSCQPDKCLPDHFMPAAAPSNAPATTVPWLFGVSLGFVLVSVLCVSLGVFFVFLSWDGTAQSN